MDEKVIVESMVGGQIVMLSPDSLKTRTWPKKGTKLPVSKDFLREAIYDPGIEYMFKHGMLAMDDMDFKIELGLEQPGAEEPTQIINTDTKHMERILKFVSINEMRDNINKMSIEQKQEFVEYASNQKDINLDRISVINELCKVDLLKIIELKRMKEV